MNFTIFIPLLLGWLAGWLVNYLADVLPATRKFSRPACPHCHAPYSWATYLSFGDCTACGKRRSLRTLLVQAALTVASLLLWIFPRTLLPYSLALLLLVFLTLVLVTDLEYRLILHPVSLAGAALGLGIGVYLRASYTTVGAGIVNTLIGGAAGFGIMLVFYFLGELYVRRMSKRRGMSPDEVALGFGDVNLSGILGLLLGWPSVTVGLIFAIFAGGLVSLGVIVVLLLSKKYKAFTPIPYAPFLIFSVIFLLYR